MNYDATRYRRREIAKWAFVWFFTVCRKIYWVVDVLRKGRKLGEGRRALASP